MEVEDSLENVSCRRSSRRKSIHTSSENKNNRKKSSKCMDSIPEENLEDVYINSNLKLTNFRPKALQTIYEVPKANKKSDESYMSAVKLKRLCHFPAFYDPPKSKIKSRKDKSKIMKKKGVKIPTGKEISLDYLKNVLLSIEDVNDDIHCSFEDSSSKFKGKNEKTSGNIQKIDINVQTLTDQMSDLQENKVYPIENLDVSSFNVNLPAKSKGRRRSFGVGCSSRFIETKNENGCSQNVEMIDQTTSPLELGSTITECVKSNVETNVSEPNVSINKPENHRRSFGVGCSSRFIETKNGNGCSQNVEMIDQTTTPLELGSTITECVKSNVETNVSEPNVSMNKPENLLDFQPSNSSKVQKKRGRRRSRRISGLRKPIYSTFYESPEDEPDQNPSNILEIDTSLTSSEQNKLPSPSTLFEKLSLDSSFVFSKPVNKGRRRSARLQSIQEMGSLWLDSPNKQAPPSDIQDETQNMEISETLVDKEVKLPVLDFQKFQSETLVNNEMKSPVHDFQKFQSETIVNNEMISPVRDYPKFESETLVNEMKSPVLDYQKLESESFVNKEMESPVVNFQKFESESFVNKEMTSPVLEFQKFEPTNLNNLEENFPNENLNTCSGINLKVGNESQDIDFNDSPLISGIIDCQATLTKSRKFVKIKNCDLNLEHFRTT